MLIKSFEQIDFSVNSNFKKAFTPLNLLLNSTILNNHFNNSPISSLHGALNNFCILGIHCVKQQMGDKDLTRKLIA